jgi:hypothetical protein
MSSDGAKHNTQRRSRIRIKISQCNSVSRSFLTLQCTLVLFTPSYFTLNELHVSPPLCINVKKCKVRPRTGHEGPEVEQKYSFILSLTSAIDGGGWLTTRPDRFNPRKRYATHCI